MHEKRKSQSRLETRTAQESRILRSHQAKCCRLQPAVAPNRASARESRWESRDVTQSSPASGAALADAPPTYAATATTRSLPLSPTRLSEPSNHGGASQPEHAFRQLQPGLHVSSPQTSSPPPAYLPRCVSVGTKKGYSITNCDPFGRVYTMSELNAHPLCARLLMCRI